MKRFLINTLIVCGMLIVPSLQAQLDHGQFNQLAAQVQPQVVEWRRWFHQHPELSNREFETSKRVAKILENMGLEVQTGIARTGIVAMLRGGKPGPLVAVRADMDGLPVTEQTGLEFSSVNTDVFNDQETGVMHACGHDAHMAMALGAAEVLSSVRDELAGTVMFIFQPAEEGPPPGEEGGASLMLDEGIWNFNKPEAIFGLHIGINQPGGRISVRPGPIMAAADIFQVTVKGKQTHGARPWNGIDPIVIASQIILGLQTVASRQVDVTKAPSIISVGRIQGGIRNNVIPDSVFFEGTIRSFDPEMREQIHARMEKTARSIAAAAGAEVDFTILKGTPPLINDADLVARMMPTLKRVSGGNQVNNVYPQTVAEDFSVFSNATPGLYFFLGNGEPGVDETTIPANHSPFFDVFEPNMEVGVRALSQLVVDYLEGE
jgi:amidohydrolase